MATLTLRDAVPADAPAVLALIREVLGEFGLPPDPLGTDADLADLDAHYLRRGGRFWVLEGATGAIDGCCALYPLGDGRVELRKMYLRPRARGQGWGRRLLAHAVAAAREDGHARIELETAEVLTDAIRLYQRSGFRRIARTPQSRRCDQLWVLDLEAS